MLPRCPQVVTRGQMRFEGRTCAWNGAEPSTVLSAQFLPPGLEDGVASLVKDSGCSQGRVGKGGARIHDRTDVGLIVTGHPTGEVLFWKDYAAVMRLDTYTADVGVTARRMGAVDGAHGVR